MKTSYDVLKNILRTEKGSSMLADNKYLFSVSVDSNKVQIRQAVEDVYNVKVVKVNTIKVQGKWKRLRSKEGKTPDWKKAIVTLKQGDRIEVATT
ncbi:MAG: 50S ribosomal protein L23 [Candidatus Omnitrophica bacterium]|nr:50S ribosomal protein L23 [Candidatus Omnitrophota bacterium]